MKTLKRFRQLTSKNIKQVITLINNYKKSLEAEGGELLENPFSINKNREIPLICTYDFIIKNNVVINFSNVQNTKYHTDLIFDEYPTFNEFKSEYKKDLDRFKKAVKDGIIS